MLENLKSHPRSVAVLLLIAATFLAYWPALRNGFVWDDTALVLRDPLIRSWRLIPEGFRHFLFLDATASNFYRPLQRLTFTADYALFGFGAPWGWHLTSICIHAAAAVALFFLGLKLSGGRVGFAFGAALVWAVHPLQTSAVTYVAGRADPLAALCGFTALLLALHSLETRRPLASTLGASIGFLGAILSKESGVFAIVLWFAVLLWRRPSPLVFAKWLLLGVTVLTVYLELRLTAERLAPPQPPVTAISTRPLLAARAVAEYAGLLLAPITLRMERDVSTSAPSVPDVHSRRILQTLAGILLGLAFALWLRRATRRHSAVAFCLLAALLAYLPVSNLFSLNATVAEHWLYIPGAFLFLAAAQAIRWSTVSLVVVSLWIAALATRTFLRQADWHDQRTFFERTIAAGGDTARMHINLGNVESAEGNPAAALAHFRAAIDRAPAQPIAWLGYANAAIRARDFSTAQAALDHTPASDLLAPEVLQTRAIFEHLTTGRDTSDLLRTALALAPRNWAIHRRLLEHLDEIGRTADAAHELRELLASEDFRADSWQLLGRFLEKLTQPAAARTAYAEAAARDVRDEFSRSQIAALTPHP